jgi:hypothetical protein
VSALPPLRVDALVRVLDPPCASSSSCPCTHLDARAPPRRLPCVASPNLSCGQIHTAASGKRLGLPVAFTEKCRRVHPEVILRPHFPATLPARSCHRVDGGASVHRRRSASALAHVRRRVGVRVQAHLRECAGASGVSSRCVHPTMPTRRECHPSASTRPCQRVRSDMPLYRQRYVGAST